jgi:hypothetical protein
MKVVRYTQTWFEVGSSGSSEAKFAAGKVYAVTDETQRHITLGIAEVIDAPEDVDKVQAVAEKAQAAAAKAADAAADAKATAEVAAAASDIKGHA